MALWASRAHSYCCHSVTCPYTRVRCQLQHRAVWHTMEKCPKSQEQGSFLSPWQHRALRGGLLVVPAGWRQ